MRMVIVIVLTIALETDSHTHTTLSFQKRIKFRIGQRRGQYIVHGIPGFGGYGHPTFRPRLFGLLKLGSEINESLEIKYWKTLAIIYGKA